MSNTNKDISLQDWISSVLAQITSGISGHKVYDKIPIQFEVGIEAVNTADSKTGGGVGIKVLSFLSLNAEGETKKGGRQAAYNKVSFTINLDDYSHNDSASSGGIEHPY